MRILTLDSRKIAKGADPTEAFYDIIEETFPELGLTSTNSYISYVKGSYLYMDPNRTIAHVVRMEDSEVFVFYYLRLDLTQVLFNYQLTQEQRDEVKTLHRSDRILEIVADEFDLEMDPSEFWVDSNTISYCNYDNDRFALSATFDNLWFTGTHYFDLTLEDDELEVETGPKEIEFLGEVTSTQFIDGPTLASEIGLSAGYDLHPDAKWLHFKMDGVEGYLASKPLRRGLSWTQLNDVGAVFGDAIVEIDNKVYKVRLLKGSSEDPFLDTNGFDIRADHGSEWNSLFYPIHNGVHIDPDNPSQHSDDLSLPYGSLASYSDADLYLHESLGDGTMCWCQEAYASNTTNRIARGSLGVTHRHRGPASTVDSVYGWRPYLELVS